MSVGALRPELRSPKMRDLLYSYLNLMVGQVEIVRHFRNGGASTLTLLDTVVNMVVFIHAEDGVRQQTIVDTMGSPRRTIRDSLTRLEQHGLIVRRAGLYLPTPSTADAANELLDPLLARLYHLCEAVNEYRDALGRNPPTRRLR